MCCNLQIAQLHVVITLGDDEKCVNLYALTQKIVKQFEVAISKTIMMLSTLRECLVSFTIPIILIETRTLTQTLLYNYV